MKIIHRIIYTLIVFSMTACQDDNSDPQTNLPPGTGGNGNSSVWLIPQNLVLDGGPGKDGIPALENPEMISSAAADYLEPGDLVIGYKVEDDIRAYSHKVLDWHEIINDEVNGKPVAITYCPLTGTGIGWGREIEGMVTTFGVSGLLYNSNLIPYDRATDSNWSQMRLDCVEGAFQGTKIKTFQLIETSWASWQAMYPNTRVVSTSTGFSRNYQRYPYGDYRTNNENIIFPVNNSDDRLPTKTRVLGVITNEAVKAYPLQDFGENTRVIKETRAGKDIVIAGNTEENWAVAYEPTLEDGTALNLMAVQDELPVIMEDQLGNRWDIFGQAVSGPNQRSRLPQLDAYIGYWFAWAAFYEGLDVYEPDSPE